MPAAPIVDLTGKVAIVTGSSRGIGRSIAEHLARAGARVVVSSRKPAACEEVAAGIRAAGGEALVVACNISDRAQCDHLIDETVKTWGRVDSLVLNAATNPYFGHADRPARRGNRTAGRAAHGMRGILPPGKGAPG